DIVADYNNIILGTSTWGVGELQDDWDEFLPNLVKEDLVDKNVALFGLGDSMGNSETFTDAMSVIAEELKATNCKILDGVSTDGYDFDESQSVVDGKFIGLAIDEDNQSELTEERIDAWLEMILPQFK
ncbi:MAG: flavodoxin, partial [Bacteroidia bacterium]